MEAGLLACQLPMHCSFGWSKRSWLARLQSPRHFTAATRGRSALFLIRWGKPTVGGPIPASLTGAQLPRLAAFRPRFSNSWSSLKFKGQPSCKVNHPRNPARLLPTSVSSYLPISRSRIGKSILQHPFLGSSWFYKYIPRPSHSLGSTFLRGSPWPAITITTTSRSRSTRKG